MPAGVRDNQRAQTKATRARLAADRKAAKDKQKEETDKAKESKKALLQAKRAKRTKENKDPPVRKEKQRRIMTEPPPRPAAYDFDLAHLGDAEEEEEEEPSDEPSTPKQRPAGGARMRRPAACDDGILTLPVHIHSRFTAGAEGQYILDARKVSVCSCT